jgi:hypothetical protein
LARSARAATSCGRDLFGLSALPGPGELSPRRLDGGLGSRDLLRAWTGLCFFQCAPGALHLGLRLGDSSQLPGIIEPQDHLSGLYGLAFCGEQFCHDATRGQAEPGTPCRHHHCIGYHLVTGFRDRYLGGLWRGIGRGRHDPRSEDNVGHSHRCHQGKSYQDPLFHHTPPMWRYS